MKIEITSDPRKQLKLIEKREKEEKERRDTEEKERALKDRERSGKKSEKSEQARLEEEEKIRTRTANMTALQVHHLQLFSFLCCLLWCSPLPQAIGDVRARRPTSAPASPNVVNTSRPPTGNAPVRQITFNRQMLDQLQVLKKMQQQGMTLSPVQSQQLAHLQRQLSIFSAYWQQISGKVSLQLDVRTVSFQRVI